MSLSIIHTRAGVGVQAPLVRVETHLSAGLPAFSIVGLPETVVRESRDRVRSALHNAQFEFPIKRITVNLSPADLPKEGSRFDLPIALGILLASEQLPTGCCDGYEFVGELGLSGELRGVHGVLPAALAAKQAARALIVPEANARDVAMGDHTTYAATHLLQVCAHLQQQQALSMVKPQTVSLTASYAMDIADVHGQLSAKRALEIAAAGGHNLLFIGPPGTGKTMLAQRMTTIMPPLNEQEATEAAVIASITGQALSSQDWGRRRFRQPHHTASAPALVGGGSTPRPGEISLAHHGILFLDELPEFDRRVLEVLREPMESGMVTISRANGRMEFPARFQLLAAMNPCPCGYYGSSHENCRCTPDQVRRYLGKLSGPFLDRLDMHVAVLPLAEGMLGKLPVDNQASALVRARVCQARDKQTQRLGKCNAELGTKDLHAVCALSAKDQQLLDQAMRKWRLSARAYHRILRVARTIADLEASDDIATPHIMEAISYRCLERMMNPM